MALNLDDFEEVIKNHMEQQPYKIRCADCGADIEVASTKVDGDLDIDVEIFPCDCTKQ